MPPMRLRRSSFVHQIPVGEGRILVIHAISHLRLVVDGDIAEIIDFFRAPRTLPKDYPALARRVSGELDTVLGAIQALVDRGVLTKDEPQAELAAITAELCPSYGRDPGALLERYRRAAKEGGGAYWAAGPARALADIAPKGPRLDVVLFGDCDIHMESDFIRREAAERGLDVRVAAAFPDDVRFVSEHPHDAVLIGALRSRHDITAEPTGDAPPYGVYIAEASRLLTALREHTAAPILIDNLPEPTVQPLGLAERGLNGHRNRFRLANVSLSQLAEGFKDVHVVDVAAAMAAAGAERMLDDGQVGFTHLGSPGWMLQRPQSELQAVHRLFPELGPLAEQLGGDPYGRETAVAKTHVDALVGALGLDQKKCVIVDLDGVLWPGVLAETGAPFAWSPEISGPFSFVGHYFGLHEALLCLKRRGVLLACVSKNDEAMVRRLWTYPDHYPRERLLGPDDFVTWRVNWEDKVENIRSIAEELGFAPEAFLFIDDHPGERDRVRQRLAEVEVWGEDLLGLRRRLLSDPRLQRPSITEEASARTELVKAQLVRQQVRAASGSERDYVVSLNLQCQVRRLRLGDRLERVEELFQRTTQFNTTGRKFTASELGDMLDNPAAALFSLNVSDRFGDHGLVGAAVTVGGAILGLVLSCRVLGLGAEKVFMQQILDSLAGEYATVSGRIAPTDRNAPCRNIYRDSGFAQDADGLWRLSLASQAHLAAVTG